MAETDPNAAKLKQDSAAFNKGMDAAERGDFDTALEGLGSDPEEVKSSGTGMQTII